MNDTQKTLWENKALAEIGSDVETAREIKFRARTPIGAALLFLVGRNIFSYKFVDAPKMAWLSKALAETGEHLLDVGVRTGNLASFFQRQGKRVYGIDIAQKYVDHCITVGHIEAGSVCNVETDKIPTPDTFGDNLPDSYDVIFMGEVLEHLLEGGFVLKKLSRVIKPGGHVILTTPNLAYLGNRIRLLFGRDLNALTIDRGEIGNQHIRVFTVRLIKRLCREAGLEVDMVGSNGIPISLARHIEIVDSANNHLPLIIFPGTRWPIPTIGHSIFIRARRL